MPASAAAHKAEIIRPPNELKGKVGRLSRSDHQTLEDLERALSRAGRQAAKGFGKAEIDRMRLAASRAQASPGDWDGALEEIYLTTHELRGVGETLDFGLVTRIGNSLCRFIEAGPRAEKRAGRILRAHVEGIALVISGGFTGDGGKFGDELCAVLEEAAAGYGAVPSL